MDYCRPWKTITLKLWIVCWFIDPNNFLKLILFTSPSYNFAPWDYLQLLTRGDNPEFDPKTRNVCVHVEVPILGLVISILGSLMPFPKFKVLRMASGQLWIGFHDSPTLQKTVCFPNNYWEGNIENMLLICWLLIPPGKGGVQCYICIVTLYTG